MQAVTASPQLPPAEDGVVRIDFHVHTNGSPEGIHELAEVVAQAKRVGLDGIAITDHNHLLPRRMATKLSRELDFLIIGGVEGGDLVRRKRHTDDHRHWIGLNLDELPDLEEIQEITENVRDNGGLTIAPHPNARNGFRSYDRLRFDAVESVNGTRREQPIVSRGIATVGGTDAHAKYMLGHTWTDVYDSDGSVESILENVRKRNCVARGSPIPVWVIARFYFAVAERYLLHEPCELIQSWGRQLRKFC